MPLQPAPTRPPPKHPQPKRIVIFADGTGNAFTTQESNVWRLYLALDKTGAAGIPQIARYIPGVGTSSRTLIRVLDGITGYGVPANVRHLYRFLCMNWDPGDEIFLFGFSRGAFTVRTLAGMIRMQGLMPRILDGAPITEGDMNRAVMAAWYAYRSETAPVWKDGVGLCMNPLIGAVRALRDGGIRIKRGLLRQRPHADVQAQQPANHAPDTVKVRLMGLFDTVEAYGVPFEELRNLINWWVWPIVFRNRQCSPVVQDVAHALSLDDARLTFHPVRFDMTSRKDQLRNPTVQEVWFAGVHSDVGGGYPDDACAMAPLGWMAGQASAAGLVFDTMALDAFARRRFDAAPIHDSRARLGSLYRFAPRLNLMAEGTRDAPMIHPSVMAKLATGVDGYAPLNLPPDMQVAGESAHAMAYDNRSEPRLLQLIDWRRGTNWTAILCITGLVFLALTPLWQVRAVPADPDWLMALKTIAGTAGPSWIGRIWQGWQTHWETTAVLVMLILVAHLVNQGLATAIRDTARRIWHSPGPAG